MKIVKHRNLMGLFFAIFMMLPMIAIGVRCAYITFNKNAKDSYYGETINDFNYLHIDDLNTGIEYSFLGKSVLTNENIYESNNFMLVENAILNNVYYDNLKFGFYAPVNGQLFLYVRDVNDNTVITSGNLGNFSGNFVISNFTLQSNTLSLIKDLFFIKEYNKYSFLDNAFIYSVHEITDNNLGKIDFFTFFANMFLDLNNPKTQIYVNFVNWYFNYMLLVSLAYLLFFVIMWFINYIRQILERGNSLGHGGF